MEADRTSRPSPLRRALSSRDLACVMLSWGVSKTSVWGWGLTMNAVVFMEAGAWAVGVFLAFRMIPGSFVTPFISVLTDRWGMVQTLVALGWLRASAMAATAALLVTDAPIALLMVVATVESFGSQPFDAVHSRAAPWLTRGVDELTAANGLTETLRMAGMLLGPVLAVLLLALTVPWIVVALFAAGAVVGAVVLRGARRDVVTDTEQDRKHLIASLDDGRKAMFSDRDTRTLVMWFAYSSLCVGGCQVYSTALAMDTLQLGTSGPSQLGALIGLGGLLGGAAIPRLMGRGQLLRPSFVSGVALGLFPTVMAAFPNLWVVYSAHALWGAALVVFMVCATTLVQRGIPPHLYAAVVGLNGVVSDIAFAVSGLFASALMSGIGLNQALGLTGVLMIAYTLRALASLRRFSIRSERTQAAVEALSRSEVFKVLPFSPLERVAGAATRVALKEGDTITAEGEPGEHLFVVDEGALAVTIEGALVNELGPGDVVGEIALLDDRPRTATVTATGSGVVYRLHRDDFLAALQVSDEAHERARALSTERQQSNSRPR